MVAKYLGPKKSPLVAQVTGNAASKAEKKIANR